MFMFFFMAQVTVGSHKPCGPECGKKKRLRSAWFGIKDKTRTADGDGPCAKSRCRVVFPQYLGPSHWPLVNRVEHMQPSPGQDAPERFRSANH